MEKQVEDTDRFVVATNNYRATGGGDLTALKSAKSIFSAPITSRTILQEFLATPPDYAALRTGQTTLSAAAGTRCIFSTGPNAQDVLTDLPFETYRVSGLTPDGRLEIELTF
jgi:2',3'-cyclic-nucleotide 2'-phosphodiesterase/3'-nucleotidase